MTRPTKSHEKITASDLEVITPEFLGEAGNSRSAADAARERSIALHGLRITLIALRSWLSTQPRRSDSADGRGQSAAPRDQPRMAARGR